jgi:bifunctional NMN adenylyltransferase/nudix hydrolase
MENKMIKVEDYPVACIIGRFQLHDLHEAHKELIDQVVAHHKKVILFLGVSRVLGTTNNPLDFTARKKMIQSYYPDINIIALPDHRYDDVWSKNLDSRIREVFPIGNVLLYGGRDSFIPCYSGQFPTKELEQRIYVSGTEIRKQVSEEIKGNPDWRAGAIYNSYNRFPVSFQTVDIACFDNTRSKLLLAKKPGEKGYRFVGGFVDPSDSSLEMAARREFREETGGNAEINKMAYVGSYRVDDWRYRSGRDKIMTALFECHMVFGRVEPSDDISELKWFEWADFTKEGFVEKTFVEEHIPLAMALIANTK